MNEREPFEFWVTLGSYKGHSTMNDIDILAWDSGVDILDIQEVDGCIWLIVMAEPDTAILFGHIIGADKERTWCT